MSINLTEFGKEAREAITQFKQIFRSNPQKLRSCIDIEKLQIKRRQLRLYNDTQLYHVIIDLIHQLEAIIYNQKSPLYEHKGLQKFIKKLQTIMRDYTLQNHSMIHIGKYSARIHLNLVQDIHTLQQEHNEETENRLIRQLRILYRLNHPETLSKIRSYTQDMQKTMPHIYKKIMNISIQNSRQHA